MKIRPIDFVMLTALLTTVISHSSLAQQPMATKTTSATVGGGTYKLTVVVSGINKHSGKFFVGLANSEETFDKKSLKDQVIEVPASGDVSIVFDSLTAGQYAVRLYQDLNDNKQMDFSGQIPSEPFGFSNVTMLMGPPNFGQCAFDLNENKSVSISLIEM